jgi:predicted nuclease of predicted toxin-antitoxin system
MRFLADVNASGALTRWLLEHGYDVLRVADVDPRMEDSKILQWAWREKPIIMTTDQDFEEMIWREKKQHYGILRLENLPRVERLSLLEYVLNHHSQDLALGAIVIASSRIIRIRKPVSSD